MRKRWRVLAISALIIVVAFAAVFALTPSTAEGQGLVEYVLCYAFSQDTGTNITDANTINVLKAIFDLEEWQSNYGAIGYCRLLFTGNQKAFSGVQSVLIVYEDIDNSEALSPGDLQVTLVRQTIQF